MSEVTFADILMITLACCVIFAILYMVNRGKNKVQKADGSPPVPATEGNQENTVEDD